MPGRDGTGPNGEGQMTGRKMGPCNKDSKTEPIGFERGCKRGLGRGFGCRPTQNQTKEKE
jgi:hypothetical protein